MAWFVDADMRLASHKGGGDWTLAHNQACPAHY
jgi:hypothetical protein